MRLKLIVCKVLQREAYLCASKSKNTIDVCLIEQGLHNEPDKLRETLQAELQNTTDIQGNEYDASLLGYGLCSNGIIGLNSKIPIIVPRGHDCITLLLGSKERYQQYFDTHKGIYWYSPGWIDTNTQPGKDRYEKLLREYTEKYGADNAEYLMQMEQGWMNEYQRATYVGWGTCDEKDYKQYSKDCATYLNWQYDEIKGDPGLMQRMLDGDWNENEFLKVNPGQKIAEDLTNKGIIKAEWILLPTDIWEIMLTAFILQTWTQFLLLTV